MTKKPFTTRLDPAILGLAQHIAAIERRSVTSVIEIALVEYGARHGFNVSDNERGYSIQSSGDEN